MPEESRFRYSRPNPRKDDVLFASDSALWHMEAVLDYRPGDDYTYREGYRLAARILTEWVEKHPGKQDFLVFPVCHAYRHFIELTLKRLLALGCALIERELTERESKLHTESHSLRELWKAFKSINKEVERMIGLEGPPQEDIEGIDAYIEQLHEVDAGSYAFRYPLTKKGEISTGDVKRINLGVFFQLIEKLCAYLEGFDAYYQHLIQERDEMRDAYASDYYPDDY